MNWEVIKDPTILMTAVVYGLLALLVSQAGLFGIWLGVLLLFSLWRYCYSALLAFAQGHKRIPPPDLESFNPIGAFSVLMHFLLFSGLMAVALIYQPGGLVLIPLLALAFPASAAVMGLTSNIAHALSPSALVGFAKTLGTDYWALVAGYIAILGGAYAVVAVINSVSGILVLLIGMIVEIWALLASFALIGSALRTHRLEFEIPGEMVPREEEMLRRRHEQWNRDLDIAYTAFRSDLNASGYKTLHDLVDANNDSLEVNHWLVENMLDWQDKKYALEVAAKLVPRLLGKNDRAGALDLYLRCRRRDSHFKLPAVQAERLADYARDVGQTGIADELSYN